MTYSLKKINKADQSTSTWSGGTTTQLAIYPESSDYKDRSFLWRLSTAGVEATESVFTSLPGIYRHIMIIEGEMTLIHEGRREIRLKPFQQDSFSGDWTTRSIGKARDFNLMLGQGSIGELEAIFLKEDIYIDGAAKVPDKGLDSVTQCFYCVSGSVGIMINNTERYGLEEGDLLMIQYPIYERDISFSLQTIDDIEAIAIRAGIAYQKI